MRASLFLSLLLLASPSFAQSNNDWGQVEGVVAVGSSGLIYQDCQGGPYKSAMYLGDDNAGDYTRKVRWTYTHDGHCPTHSRPLGTPRGYDVLVDMGGRRFVTRLPYAPRQDQYIRLDGLVLRPVDTLPRYTDRQPVGDWGDGYYIGYPYQWRYSGVHR